jgi:hypothetical protein
VVVDDEGVATGARRGGRGNKGEWLVGLRSDEGRRREKIR